MYNTSNPAELYAGTTWELLPNNKFLKTGSTPLQQAGSNSISITKANLPNISLKVNSFSVTTPDHNHNLRGYGGGDLRTLMGESPCIGGISGSGRFSTGTQVNNTMQKSNGGSTGTASPSTESLGSGTPITVNPEHITVRAWKRLS